MLIPGAPLGVITEAVQALAGVLLPSATVFLLLLCNEREVLGPWRNGPWLNALATLVVAVLILLSLILMATTVFPSLDVTKLMLYGALGVGVVLVLLGLRGVARPPRGRACHQRRGLGSPAGAVDDAAARPSGPADVVDVAQGRDAHSAHLPRALDRDPGDQGGPARRRLIPGPRPRLLGLA